VAHGEDLEEEAAVEGVGVALDRGLERDDAPVEVGRELARDAGAQLLELGQPLAAGAVLVEALDLSDQLVVARKSRSEDDAGRIAQLLRQAPAVGRRLPVVVVL